MKKTILVITLFALAGPIWADSTGNTLRIEGEVHLQTCEVTIDGIGANPVLRLPTVPMSALSTANTAATSVSKTFVVELKNCTAPGNGGVQIVNTVFVSTNPTANGNMRNRLEGQAGGAVGVSLRLFDPANLGKVFNLNMANGFRTQDMQFSGTQTTARYTYGIQYFREREEDGFRAGAVLADLQYAISYN